jgi:hypothetical protein
VGIAWWGVHALASSLASSLALPDVVEYPDVVKRRRLPLAEISPEDAKLRAAYDYWQSKRRNGMLPSRKDIDVIDLRPVIGKTHIVDVSRDDPASFQFRLFGSSVPSDVLNQSSDKSVGDLMSKALQKSVIEDYTAVCFTGTPAYHHLVAMLDFIVHSYARLILPLAENGRQVDKLVVCVNARTFPDLQV